MPHNKFRSPDSLRADTESTLILIDFSNLMYRAWFVSKERPWIAYCKFFDMLRLCVRRSKQPGVPINVIFAGESRAGLKRSEIFKGYKEHRTPNKNPEFSVYRMCLYSILKRLGWELLYVNGAEADDVIASIVARKCHRCYCKVPCKDCDCALKYKTDVVIFSGDRDLQQCLAWDRVLIYRAPGIFVDKAGFKKEYGIPVEKYHIYKALVGDKSDNIKGVEGFGPVKACIAINANSVAEDIWEIGGYEASEEFKLSLKLVALDHKLPLGDNLDDLYSGSPKIEGDWDLDPKILFELKRLKEEFK